MCWAQFSARALKLAHLHDSVRKAQLLSPFHTRENRGMWRLTNLPLRLKNGKQYTIMCFYNSNPRILNRIGDCHIITSSKVPFCLAGELTRSDACLIKTLPWCLIWDVQFHFLNGCQSVPHCFPWGRTQQGSRQHLGVALRTKSDGAVCFSPVRWPSPSTQPEMSSDVTRCWMNCFPDHWASPRHPTLPEQTQPSSEFRWCQPPLPVPGTSLL